MERTSRGCISGSEAMVGLFILQSFRNQADASSCVRPWKHFVLRRSTVVSVQIISMKQLKNSDINVSAKES